VWEYAVVCAVALLASALTFFSGFGLGTLLLPAFAAFFPPGLAVAMTAVVHLANSLFKLGLVGRFASRPVVWRFGLPAIVASFAGAALLVRLTDLAPLAEWSLGERAMIVTPLKLVVAGLMAAFALVEGLPHIERYSLGPRYLPLGGVLSGFFGGLSGHQGALRSAFLLRCGLDARGFVGTGVAIACLVDITRLVVYADRLDALRGARAAGPMLAATLAAFVGALAGRSLLPKVSMRWIQTTVAILLVVLSLALGSGLL